MVRFKDQGLSEIISLCCLAVVLLTLPFSIKINSLSIIAALVISIVQYNWLNFKYDFVANRRLFVISLILILQLIGMINTSDIESGVSVVERSLLTVAIPLFFLLSPKIQMKNLNFVIDGFIILCSVICFYCLLGAVYNIISSGSLYNLDKASDRTYYYLSSIELAGAINIHPFYLGLLLNLSIGVLLIRIFWSDRGYKFKKAEVAVLIGLTAFQFALFSFNALLSLSVLWWTSLFRYFRFSKLFLAASILLVFSIFFIVMNDGLIEMLEYEISAPHISSWNSLNFRVAIWDNAIGVIRENILLGVGTGDADNILFESYSKSGFTLGASLEFNAHNQFLQFLIMHGLPGGLLLLAILIYQTRTFVVEKNKFGVVFIICIFIGFLTEVVLTRQKGMVFYCLFSCLFLQNNISITNSNEE